MAIKTIKKDNVPDWWLEESRSYHKKGSTDMFPAPENCLIETQEGVVKCNKDDMIAFDVEGFPYPIKKSVFKKSYELDE